MENEQDKLIENQLKTLPAELQQAIQSVPWKNIVQEIGRTNSLTPDQMTSFDQETMFIIYGFENPNDYIQNLVRELNVSEDIANVLANAVAEKILSQINEKTRKPALSNLSRNEIKQDLIRQREQASVGQKISPNIPEIAPEIHPMTQEGGVKTKPSSDTVLVLNKDDAKKVLGAQPPQPKVTLPDYRYEGGADPYREPLK